MITWGISANSHDAGLAVFDNKKLVFASQSERFSSCLLYTSPSPRDLSTSRMPSSA